MLVFSHANFLFKHLYPSPSMVLFSVIYTEGVILFPLNFCFAKLNKPKVSAAKHASHSSGQTFFLLFQFLDGCHKNSDHVKTFNKLLLNDCSTTKPFLFYRSVHKSVTVPKIWHKPGRVVFSSGVLLRLRDHLGQT